MTVRQLVNMLVGLGTQHADDEVFFENLKHETYPWLSVNDVKVLGTEKPIYILLKCTKDPELDRVRLMDGLEKCSGLMTNDQDLCQSCPYFKEQDCTGKLAKDALARIKELESK